MSKNLSLTLNAADIRMAVQSDTHITAMMEKSEDMVKNAAVAFNESADNSGYHATKLFRTLKAALAQFEAAVAEYVETADANAVITDTLSAAADTTFTITITVNDRTSGAFARPMAHIAQEFIINMMLYYWWQPIKPELAKDYLTFSTGNIADFRRMLAKAAPTASNTPYSDISGQVTPNVEPTVRSYYLTHVVVDEQSQDERDVFLIPTSLICSIRSSVLFSSKNYGGQVKLYNVNDDYSSECIPQEDALDPTPHNLPYQLSDYDREGLNHVNNPQDESPYYYVAVEPLGETTENARLLLTYYE